MKNNLMDLKDVLIISDYDRGYRFSVYWNAQMHIDGDADENCNTKLLDVCYEFIIRPHALQEALEELNIYPKYIIVCSDGGIEITKINRRIGKVESITNENYH